MGRITVFRITLVIIGFISVGLGVIGVFLPLLPTTPFLLLAAACFLRSSDRLYKWLINHRVLGKYIKYFQVYKAIPIHTKLIAISLIWATIGYTVIAVLESLLPRIILAIIAVAVSIYLISLKRLTKEMLSSQKDGKSHP